MIANSKKHQTTRKTSTNNKPNPFTSTFKTHTQNTNQNYIDPFNIFPHLPLKNLPNTSTKKHDQNHLKSINSYLPTLPYLRTYLPTYLPYLPTYITLPYPTFLPSTKPQSGSSFHRWLLRQRRLRLRLDEAQQPAAQMVGVGGLETDEAFVGRSASGWKP